MEREFSSFRSLPCCKLTCVCLIECMSIVLVHVDRCACHRLSGLTQNASGTLKKAGTERQEEERARQHWCRFLGERDTGRLSESDGARPESRSKTRGNISRREDKEEEMTVNCCERR